MSPAERQQPQTSLRLHSGRNIPATKKSPLTCRRAAIMIPPGSRTPVYREPRPLVKSETGEKESSGEMICQMSKVAAAIVTQLAQELQLRAGVIA
jgi:hypothetical protein